MQETQVRSLVWEDPLEKEMATSSSILWPGKFHEQRSLTGTVHGVAKRVGHTLATKQEQLRTMPSHYNSSVVVIITAWKLMKEMWRFVNLGERLCNLRNELLLRTDTLADPS